MQRARLKPDIWDVWQLKNGAARPLWVLDWTELEDEKLYLRQLEGSRLPLHPGDWLVRALPAAPPLRETDETFRRDYEIVP